MNFRFLNLMVSRLGKLDLHDKSTYGSGHHIIRLFETIRRTLFISPRGTINSYGVMILEKFKLVIVDGARVTYRTEKGKRIISVGTEASRSKMLRTLAAMIGEEIRLLDARRPRAGLIFTNVTDDDIFYFLVMYYIDLGLDKPVNIWEVAEWALN